MSKIDISDEVWGIYQHVGRYGSEIISNPKDRKEFIQALRDTADKLESTLPPEEGVEHD